ncbi:Hypothetical predicted protein [Octopus vulgaris]|nr:Hypothetical predicted protein [Octopus vulgaris]
MTMLDQFCVELKLGNEERCSGVVVASYLAHHGANFYCKNKSGRTPLDLIEKENLKKTLNMLFRPTPHGGGRRMDQALKGPIRCVFCEDEVATETFFPCKHLSLSIFLGVDTTKLKIDDETIDAVKQGYLMLYEWYRNCDPETRTHATLRAALEEAECVAVMECLSLDAK